MRTLAFALLCFVYAQLSSGTARADGAMRVVVTIHPLALILEQLGGDDLEVHVLVPPGASPHAFEPRPSDLLQVARARLFVSVGGGLDDWAARLAQGAGEAIESHSMFALLGRETDRDQDHHDHTDLENDPHVWLDPIGVRDAIAPAITKILVGADPANEARYRERHLEFRQELGALDREIAGILAVESRDYLAFHNAWRLFAARYALREIAVVEEAAGEQPTPQEFANLVRDARRAGVGAVLIEPQFDPRMAETLGQAFDGITVLVDPLGDPRDEFRSTYAGLLRFNARAFRKALEANRTAEP